MSDDGLAAAACGTLRGLLIYHLYTLRVKLCAKTMNKHSNLASSILSASAKSPNPPPPLLQSRSHLECQKRREKVSHHLECGKFSPFLKKGRVKYGSQRIFGTGFGGKSWCIFAKPACYMVVNHFSRTSNLLPIAGFHFMGPKMMARSLDHMHW